jgi:hypothetical protein
LSNKIEPGKWTTLSVDLDAPNAAGTYTGNWRFAHADGTPFGSLLPVSIRVERNPDPTKTPTSTNTPPTPANTPNLQQTLDALNTAVAGTAAAAATQTAIEATTTP